MNLRVTLAAAVATASVVAVAQIYNIQEADGLSGKSAKTGSEAASTGKLELAPISTAKVGINADGVLINKSPDSSSPTLAAVGRGKVAWVKARVGDWYKLKFPSGTVGYVKREFLTGIPLVQPTSGKSATIIRNAVVVRKGASTKTGRIAIVDRGKTARILGKVGDWYKLKFASGTVGYVRRDCLTTEPLAAVKQRNWRNATRSDYYAAIDGDSTDLIAEAKRHLGTRYVWGGTTTRGFDCSGFVRYVYGKAEGITLPRTSREQARFGVRVPKAELQAGDVLSFASRGGSRINHSGIYIGNGKFIHASSGGGRVRIDSLQGYYAKRLISAHRPKAKLKSRFVQDAITEPNSGNGAKTD